MNAGGRPRVLAILYGLVGDTLMRLPALRALRTRHPGLHLTALCEPLLAPALRADPLFDRVIASERHGAGPLAFWRLVRELRRGRYDVALDFYYGGRTPLLAWLSGARRRIGPAKSRWARLLLSDPVPFPLPPIHMVDRHLEIVRPLGVTALQRSWEFPLPAAANRSLRAALAAAGLGDVPAGRDIVVAAGAGDISKRWDDDLLRQALARIAAGGLGPDRRVLLVADQRAPASLVELAALPGVTPLPPLDLAQLGALFARAALVIVPDTGPLHVALGCAPRVLTFYQATDPALHAAERPGHRYLYRVVCPHQPCDTRLKHLCRLECRRSISPDELLAAAADLLSQDAKTGDGH